MPIASGANGWPTAYKAFKAQKAANKLPPASPPPPYTKTQPASRPIYHRYPHTSRPKPPPPKPKPQRRGPCGNGGGCGGGGPCGGGGGGPCGGGGGGPCGGGGGGPCGGGPGGGGCGANGGPCGAPGGAQGIGSCCCYCGGPQIYTTGVAGANAGCFAGGMFSSKNPPYPSGQSDYTLQNTGRHRCCACVIGMTFGLLLLGLILGLCLALDPYLKTQNAVSDFLANNPGAYVVGEIIVVPKPTHIDYYKYNGAEEPCNQFNNNSAYPAPTVGYNVVSGPATTDLMPFTDPVQVTLPDCNTLTTNIVWSYSVPITGPPTTVNPNGGGRLTPLSVQMISFAGIVSWNVGQCLK